MLNEQHFYLLGQIQNSQTGSKLYNDASPMVSVLVLLLPELTDMVLKWPINASFFKVLDVNAKKKPKYFQFLIRLPRCIEPSKRYATTNNYFVNVVASWRGKNLKLNSKTEIIESTK